VGSRTALVLSLLLAAVAVLLIWLLRSSTRPVEAAPPRVTQADPVVPPRLPPAVRLDAATRAAAPPPPDPPKPDEQGALQPVADTIADARARLLVSTRSPGRPGGGVGGRQRLVFWYTLVTDGTNAHIEDVEPIDSDLGDAALAQCVIDRVTAARWPMPSASPGRRKLQESFSAADLTP
jgi:hypothetical protein